MSKKECMYIVTGLAALALVSSFIVANEVRKNNFEKLQGKITVVVGYDLNAEHTLATNGFFSSDPERDVREGRWDEEVVVKCKDSKRAIKIRNKILEILEKN